MAIRRVKTKTHIPDNEDFCKEIINSVDDEAYIGAESIALIVKDELMVKVFVKKMEELSISKDKVKEVLTIYSLQPLATRLLKGIFSVVDDLPVEKKLLPKLANESAKYDLIIGNPPQSDDKKATSNNDWADQFIKIILADNSPVKPDGSVAVCLPVRNSALGDLKKKNLQKILGGVERHFVSNSARQIYVWENKAASEDASVKIIKQSGDESELPYDVLNVIGKTLDEELMKIQTRIVKDENFEPKYSSRIHTGNKKPFYIQNENKLVCCIGEEDGGECGQSIELTDDHIKVWDWSFNDRGHRPFRYVKRSSLENSKLSRTEFYAWLEQKGVLKEDDTSERSELWEQYEKDKYDIPTEETTTIEEQVAEQYLLEAGYGVPKVVWKFSCTPFNSEGEENCMTSDLEGEMVVSENSLYFPVRSETEAENIMAYFKTQFFKILQEEFKMKPQFSKEYICVPKIEPMTDEKLAEHFDLSNRLRIELELPTIDESAE